MSVFYERDGITILHADCRDVLPGIDPATVALVLADPPYGMRYRHGKRRGGVALGFDGATVIGDDTAFDPSPLLGFRNVVLWGGNHYADKLPPSRGWIVWDKRGGITSNDQSDCELAWTSFLTTARLYYQYWNGGGISEKRFHPTQKPVALMRWIIERWTKPGDLILDPYMGSGPIPAAAYQLGRRCLAIEIEERYCEIAVRRLQQSVLPLEVPA